MGQMVKRTPSPWDLGFYYFSPIQEAGFLREMAHSRIGAGNIQNEP